jgi:hypothetical protein
MRRISFTFALTLFAFAGAEAQSALRPLPSSRGITEIVLSPPSGQAPAGAAPTAIRVDYGVPHLRGRTLHTPTLVPYGVPWRTGANAPTTLKTDVDIMLGGVRIAKGTYVLFTLPTAAGWTLIVQRGEAQSTTGYDAAHDVARVELRRTTLAQPLESLTMWLIPSTEAGGPGRGELRMAWGSVQLSVDWSIV